MKGRASYKLEASCLPKVDSLRFLSQKRKQQTLFFWIVKTKIYGHKAEKPQPTVSLNACQVHLRFSILVIM